VAAHQGACDQLDDLKVLLQVLDDTLWRRGRRRSTYLFNQYTTFRWISSTLLLLLSYLLPE
jgi:hypothetical protein